MKTELKSIGRQYFTKFQFAVIPVTGKNPFEAWGSLKEAEYTEQTFESYTWDAGITGLAAILGKNNLRVIDIDGAENDELANMIVRQLGLPKNYPWKVKSGSGKGYHIYFYCQDDKYLTEILGGTKAYYQLKPKERNLCHHAELRWCGCLIILPHSHHASGRKYEFCADTIDSIKVGPTEVRIGRVIEVINEFFEPNPKECNVTPAKQKAKTNVIMDELTIRNLDEASKTMQWKVDNYQDWFRILMALAWYGEEGLPYLLKIGLNNPKYPKDTEEKLRKEFTAALKTSDGRIKLGTFFEIAKKYGYIKKVEKFWTREGGKILIRNEKLLEFMEEAGIRRIQNGENYEYIFTKGNIVERTDITKIKQIVMEFVKTKAEASERDEILGLLIKHNRFYFGKGQMDFVRALNQKFLRDTKDKSYQFFADGCYEVTADNINKVEYYDLDGVVWKDKIIKHQLSNNIRKSEFETFIGNVCNNDAERKLALETSIGYLLNNYKDPSQPKAIIYIDEKISEGANGRTGKGLTVNAIKKMKKTVRKEMSNADMNRPFSYQTVDRDTELIWMDEIPPNFNYHCLFGHLSEGIEVEKKNKTPFILCYEESPKYVLTSNHSVGGMDESTMDRQFVVEFADHYSIANKPIHEFKHEFFTGWDETEWNAFYWYMLGCLQKFLKYGLRGYAQKNVLKKKLIAATSKEFEEFSTKLQTNKRYNKKELYNKFNEKYAGENSVYITSNAFTKHLGKYAEYTGCIVQTKKSNDKYYITFMTK